MLAFGNSLIYKGSCNQTWKVIKGIDSPVVGEVCSTVARRGSSIASDLPSSSPVPRYPTRSNRQSHLLLVSPLRTPHRLRPSSIITHLYKSILVANSRVSTTPVPSAQLVPGKHAAGRGRYRGGELACPRLFVWPRARGVQRENPNSAVDRRLQDSRSITV